jgi:hypothetical protein
MSRVMIALVLLGILAPAAPASDYFTVVLLPDTQKYSESWPEIYLAQTQWIRDNVAAENIVFVSHLGDIVENGAYGPNGNIEEWLVADQAMMLLDHVVPWGIVIGNHDFDSWTDPHAGSLNYLQFFHPARFFDDPGWGGADADGYNTYRYFEGAGRRFLALHLIPDIPEPAITWAQSVIDAHPGVPTMISTHVYMKQNGRTLFPYMDLYDPTWGGHSGEEIYQMLAVPNPQVFLVTCGHMPLELFQISPNSLGQDVLEMLADYQLREFGGQGFLRLLRFYPDEDRIDVLTYSPWLNEFETDADSQFSIAMDFLTRLGPELADLNADGVVDIADFAAFAACFAGPDVPLAPPCGAADQDRDTDADLRDFARMQRRVGT